MSNLKYAAIIVVYNKTIQGSITCESIKKLSDADINIVIVDNSEKEYGNAAVCKRLGYQYISMGGNKGLSKAYNAAIDEIDSDVVILFDDDTHVSEEYFEALNEAVNNYPEIDIFAPIVYGQDGVIYSPNEFNFLRNHFISAPEQEVTQNSFNSIASCLAIRRKVFNEYRFNETLFVDQIDQYFFCEQRKMGRKFMKLDVKITQNFYQRGTNLDAKAAWNRVRLRLIDVMRHARLMGKLEGRGALKYKMLGFVKCCGLSAQIAKKSKSIGVLFKGSFLSLKLLLIPQKICER